MNKNNKIEQLIEWSIKRNNIAPVKREKRLREIYDSITSNGFDNIEHNDYLDLIAFYIAEILKDIDASKYLSSILLNTPFSLTTILRDKEVAKNLSRSLIIFRKKIKQGDKELIDFLNKFMEK